MAPLTITLHWSPLASIRAALRIGYQKKREKDILPKRPPSFSSPHIGILPGNKNYPHLYDFLTFWLLMPQMRWCCWLSDFVAKPLSVSYLISSKCLLFENIVMLGLFHFQSLSLSFRKYILKRWVLLHWLWSVTMIFHLSIIGTCYGATSVWYDKQITGWTNTPHHHQHNHLFSVVVVGHSI